MRAGPALSALRCAALLAGLGAACGPEPLHFEPAVGDADGGQEVRIVGSEFLAHGPVAVYFGLRSARAVVIEDDRRIAVKTPEAEGFGPTDIRVEFADGTVLELPQAFTYEQVDGKPLRPIPFRPGAKPLPEVE